jgi:hypothetical protein
MPAPRALAESHEATPRHAHRWVWLRNMPLLIRVCIGALLGLLLLALFVPFVAWVDPARQELLMRLQAPAGFGGVWGGRWGPTSSAATSTRASSTGRGCRSASA